GRCQHCRGRRGGVMPEIRKDGPRFVEVGRFTYVRVTDYDDACWVKFDIRLSLENAVWRTGVEQSLQGEPLIGFADDIDNPTLLLPRLDVRGVANGTEIRVFADSESLLTALANSG